MSQQTVLFWFRRDLRLDDNAGLYHALRSGHQVLPVFVFDTNILDELKDKQDKRVSFIHEQVTLLAEALKEQGSTLYVYYGTPTDCYKKLLQEYDIAAVYTNHDYEPYAKKRDEEIAELLLAKNIPLYTYKDQVIFEKSEVVKDDNTPYTVFTPYSKKWKAKLNDFYLKSYPTTKYFEALARHTALPVPTLQNMGFEAADADYPSKWLDHEVAKHYDKTRDYPAKQGTTRLSLHLRFGTISIRKVAAKAKELNDTLLNELIWRDFYQCILWHFPHVVNYSFKKEYDNIKWRNNEEEFERWCTGTTGYPIVDAGMRELNETGYMHNRVRMIVASFLTKHLLVDWRKGEAYFAEKLLDYDLAANNGGWQWAAGSGCDAAPYFRVFNPYLQTEKFDPKQEYIKQWVPELSTKDYPAPVMEHDMARKRCLEVYKEALKKE